LRLPIPESAATQFEAADFGIGSDVKKTGFSVGPTYPSGEKGNGNQLKDNLKGGLGQPWSNIQTPFFLLLEGGINAAKRERERGGHPP